MSDSKPQKQPLALIIDDDMSLRIAMQAALHKSGFEVLEADNGAEGIEIFAERRPDLVLLDVVMPEMSGYETCSALRQLPGGKYAQILMVTGLDDTESIDFSFEAGADGFVAKPINWSVLGHRCKYMVRAGSAFRQLDQSRKRLAKTQEIARLGHWEIDLVTNEFSCSREAAILMGNTAEPLPVNLKEFLTSVYTEDQEDTEKIIEAALSAHKGFSVDYRIVNEGGEKRNIQNHGEILYNEEGEPATLLGAVQDISALKAAEEEIRSLAFYDNLTGLANRMLFKDRLNFEIQQASRAGQKFALLYLDLDQFKLINDTFGHHIGDKLLTEVAGLLKTCLRSSDITSRMNDESVNPLIARLGGDEFTVILTDIKEVDNAAFVARRIIEKVARPYTLDGHEIYSSVSIGISLYPFDSTDAIELLKYADTAMYQAKRNGRNNYQFYKSSYNFAAVERFTLERDLARAIAEDELIIHYQPKINTKTQSIVGAEALIRWQHPQRGLIPPNVFIPIAEESGFIVDLTRFVVRTASRHWRQWQSEGLEPGLLSVNLSAYRFAQQNIIAILRESLSEEDDPVNLEVEITENVLMQDTTSTKNILQNVREMGIGVALDDFGTGYSSLNYLVTYPVNTIKIDRSFVKGCELESKKGVVIRSMVEMIRRLDMKCVAEGVETEEELMIISDLGVEEIQGFYFSKPLPQEEFADYLRHNQT
ncbi:MAG: EAL domain-containing protein [Desulfocapsaceae bacterium]|nr:EAL domain-containing protein [Desulfocapsaceae bacterium]